MRKSPKFDEQPKSIINPIPISGPKSPPRHHSPKFESHATTPLTQQATTRATTIKLHYSQLQPILLVKQNTLNNKNQKKSLFSRKFENYKSQKKITNPKIFIKLIYRSRKYWNTRGKKWSLCGRVVEWSTTSV